MTREVWLVFFGNAREPHRPVPRVKGRRPSSTTPSATSPTRRRWRSATSPGSRARARRPHESPRIMTTPIAGPRVPAPAVGGLLSLPFQRPRVPHRLARPRLRGRSRRSTRARSSRGSCSRALSVTVGLIGIAVAHRLYRSGLRRPTPIPVSSASVSSAGCSATRTTSTSTIGRIVAGPLTAVRRLARPVRRQGHRRRRERGRAVSSASLGGGLRKPRPASSATTRSASWSARSGSSSSCWFEGRDRGDCADEHPRRGAAA